MSNVSDEYRTIAGLAGWTARATRGRLRVEGRDARSFLHALLSNEIESLQPGQGTYATYLTPQGRMIADVAVYNAGDHLLLDVPVSLSASLAQRFDQLIFSEDVRVEDVSAPLAHISVVGERAEDALARALGVDASVLRALGLRAHLVSGSVRIARTDDVSLPSFDVFVQNAELSQTLAQFGRPAILQMSAELAESLRIDAGRPRFGVDMTDETIPLEAGLLERAISQTKGCYVGQEVIIRVLHRGGGRVAKRLVRLAFDPSVTSVPAPGAPLHTESGETGRITSAAFSPRDERVIALGYVHRDVAEAGRRVHAGDAPAEILGLAG
jgi:folate-binding protein YgfZ